MWIFKKFHSSLREEAFSMKKHQQNVNIHNKKMLLSFLVLFGSILPFALVSAFFGGRLSVSVMNYIVVQIIVIILAILYKKGTFDYNPLVGLQIMVLLVYIFGIILSVFVSPHHRATILLGIICIVPSLYIDKFLPKLYFTFFAIIAHSILAYFFKDSDLLILDFLNIIAFIFIGLFVGYVTQKSKLDFFEVEKQLILERETDILTGLKNKRKLYELFTKIEASIIKKPSCVIMIDIDHFKEYNDTFGHCIGDQFLSAFGEEMLALEEKYPIEIYRYGGEEIAAFLWDCDKAKQKEITEKIRYNVEHMDIKHKRTVSIGYVDYDEYYDITIEKAIELADSALYIAKNYGRNKVMIYERP